MAGKSHVDNNVVERRLRPIYDCLDNGNNKRALQESDKVLKKQPQLQCARVLKSLALLRLGKENECEAILESVRKEIPTDDPTLQAMTICYREINKPELICELYAAAAKVDTNNEELLTHLFMAYVRVGDYKKQQLTAMALYKLKPKNPYYFWAVMSIVMQARHSAEPHLAKDVVLPLAERMVKRFVQEEKIEAEQEVQLYIMVLEMQDKLEEALEVVNGPLGDMLQSYVLVPAKKVELLVKLKKWKEANILVKKLLLDDLDNWNFYQFYFESLFHLHHNSERSLSAEESDEQPDSSFEDGVKFLATLTETNLSNKKRKVRGPCLAQLEFYSKLHQRGENPEKYVGSLCDLLINYFQQFGAKQCCLNDLRPYLNIFNKADITTFLERIWKLVELEEGQLPTSKEQMLRYISNLHITRYLGFHEDLSCDAKLHLTSCLMRYYHHADQFNNPDALVTDILDNDPFAMLVAHMLTDVWFQTKDANYIKEAILVLEFSLEKSQSNFQMKLLLINLYNTLGISKGAHRIFDLLDIKHMQLDSLGYLQCWPLLSTCQFLLATQLFDSTLKFFTSNYKDSADHLTFSYKFGSFLKISEFVVFRDKLNNSLHYAMVTVEKMLLEIFQSTSFCQTILVLDQMMILAEEDKTDWNNLSDNRDLEVYWTPDPLHKRVTDEMIKQSFKQDFDLLKIRSLILRIVAASVELTHYQNCCNGMSNGSSRPPAKETLSTLVEQLKSLMHSLSENPPTTVFQNIITAPQESRLLSIVESPLISLVIGLSETILDLTVTLCVECEKPNKIPSLSVSINNLEENIREIFSNLESSVMKNICNKSYRQKLLNKLSLHTEIVCLIAIACGVFHKLVKTSNKPSLVKKGKKKKEVEVNGKPKVLSDVESHQTEIIKRFVSTVDQQLNKMLGLVTTLDKLWQEIDTQDSTCFLLQELGKINEDSPVFILNNKLREMHTHIEFRFSESYSSSLAEVQSNLSLKCKYLSELIF